MGMDSTQARLLAITAQLHDTEYRQQRITSEILALAVRKGSVSKEYAEDINAKIIKVNFKEDGQSKLVDANYETLCKYNECRQGSRFILRSAKNGLVYVDPETKHYYEDYINDKYSFAWAMIGRDGNASVYNAQSIGIGANNYGSGSIYMSTAENEVFNKHYNSDPETQTTLDAAYDNLVRIDNDDSSTPKAKRDALNYFRELLYKSYSKEIYEYMKLNPNYIKPDEVFEPAGAIADGLVNFPKAEFEYYLDMFEDIKQAGGCCVIDYNCTSGDDGTEWLNNMVNSGQVIISAWNKSTNKWREWDKTTIGTNISTNGLQEVDDKEKQAKAEAKHEHEMRMINSKEKILNQQLTDLEAIEKALTAEQESYRKFINENIDRTYNLFS